MYSSSEMSARWTEYDGYAVLLLTDPYTYSESEAALSQLLSPAVLKPSRFLVDRRQASPPTPDYVRGIARFLQTHADELEGVQAAVLVGDQASFGMGRMLQLLAEARDVTARVRIFQKYDEALDWLAHGG